MKNWLRRFRVARHCLVRAHGAHVNLLPAALTEVIETSEISTEEIAGGDLAQRTEAVLQVRLDLQALEKSRRSNIDWRKMSSEWFSGVSLGTYRRLWTQRAENWNYCRTSHDRCRY